MFKIDDCFKSCSIFNDILIKRFEDNFNQYNESRLWMTPGHIIFTTDRIKIHTCDARPYDLSSSPSEPDSDELLIAAAPVLDIIFDTETPSTRMFVVLRNGDVQIFEYRVLLFEWARIGYFNLNISSPNTNNNHHPVVTQVLISHHQNMIYWSEESDSSDRSTTYNLYKREVPLNGVREITQSAIGVTQKILKNCPCFNIFEIRDNMCIVPNLPNDVHFYLILSARSHLWLFNINGKCLWRGAVADSFLDFISLCAKTVGLWTQGGTVKVCYSLENIRNRGYILHNDTLLSLAFTGEICDKKKIELKGITNNFSKCFIIHNSLFSFSENLTFLYIHSIENGRLVQILDLSVKEPVKRLWYHSSNIPSIGFYTDNKIYKINFKCLRSILNSDPECFSHVVTILKQEYFHIFALLKYSVLQKFSKNDFPALRNIPTVLQSESLLLAILHSYYERGYGIDTFPFPKSMINNILDSGQSLKETSLKENLQPLVECFLKIEESKRLLLS